MASNLPNDASTTVKATEQSALARLQTWGKSSLPPTLLATLVTSLHASPMQPLALSFAPALLFSTYLNLNNFVTDSAGFTAALSGLYLILARRRKAPGATMGQRFMGKFGVRGVFRGLTMGVAGVNVIAGGLVYGFSKREREVGEGQI